MPTRRVEYNYASAFADLDEKSNDKYSSYLKFYTHIIKILNSCPFLHICNIWDEKENNFTSQSSYAYIQFQVPCKAAKWLAQKIMFINIVTIKIYLMYFYHASKNLWNIKISSWLLLSNIKMLFFTYNQTLFS